MRNYTHYRLQDADGFENFCRHLIGQPRVLQPVVAPLKSLPAIEPRSYAASLELRGEGGESSGLDRRNRRQMLRRVRADWIEGVLQQSLYQVARIEMGLQTLAAAVERPLRVLVQTADEGPATVPAGTPIGKLFDDHAGALLILGAPGTGKTTLLLELAQDLLDRAEQDDTQPIPVVFNLSSWVVRHGPLGRWLIDELNERSDVPKRLARRWVESEQIIPLLDGLDEVAADYRQACTEAINEFRREHGLLPMVVCSRIGDYEALGTKLRLRNAVVVLPLPKSSAEHYLQQIGEPVKALRAALAADPSLWELLQTPLMLWVSMLAYRDAAIEFPAADSLEQRRRRVLGCYVDAMFKRRAVDSRYGTQQTLAALSWLAQALQRNGQTVFYLENLSEAYLPGRRQRWLSRLLMVIGSAAICAAAGALIPSASYWLGGGFLPPYGGVLVNFVAEFVFAFAFGMAAGLIGATMNMLPSRWVNIRPTYFSPPWLRFVSISLAVGWGVGCAAAAITRVVSGISVWNAVGIRRGIACGLLAFSVFLVFLFFRPWRVRAPRSSMSAILRNGIVFSAMGGLSRLIMRKFRGSVEDCAERWRVAADRPNRRTRLSCACAVVSALAAGLTAGALIGLDSDWTAGLVLGMLIAVVAGFAGGGLFALRHGVVRLALQSAKCMPTHGVSFLDEATRYSFLRRAGGGYLFESRWLSEYLAQMRSTDSWTAAQSSAPATHAQGTSIAAPQKETAAKTTNAAE